MTEYHGREAKTALGGVSVTAANAGSVMSDANGHASLQFRTLKVGDQIQFRRIDMAGYEVMNTEAIDAARIARPSASDPDASTLRIVMAPRQLLRQLRDGYRSVAVQRYEKQLKASEAEIEQLREAGKLAEEEYNERMNQLEEEYENKLSQLETYIEKFSRIDLSDLDADEQQIIELVQQGSFDEALAIYDKQDLANRLLQSRADQQKLAEASQQIAAAERQKSLENQRLRQSIDRQVTLLRMAGGEENLMKAYEIIHQTFLADTTDCDARRTYAVSLVEQGRNSEAANVLQAGITPATDSYNHGMLLLDLMDINWNDGDYDQGFALAQQADSILFPIRESNYKVLTRGLPAVFGIYLNHYYVEEDFKACKQVMERVDRYWTPDTLNSSSLKSYIELLGNMSEYYFRINNGEKSLWCTQQLLAFSEQFHKLKPWTNINLDSYTEACFSYAMNGKNEEAIYAARHSMYLLAELKEHGFRKSHYFILCYDFLRITDALNAIEQYQLCDSIVQLASKYQVFELTDQYFPHENDIYYGIYQLTSVTSRLHQGALADAEQRYDAGIARLTEADEDGSILQQMQPGALAQIRQAQGQFSEAEKLYREAISHFATLYKESGDAQDADNQCRHLLMLAEMQAQQGNRKQCQRTLKEAERVAVFAYSKQRIENIKKTK